MARVTDNTKIEFSSPATAAELLEAIEDLRSRFGNDVPVRTLAFLGGTSVTRGSFVKAVIAEPGTTAPKDVQL